MNCKKQSLFKQKLKQAKIDKEQNQKQKQMESQEIQSFPKVFKIDNIDIKNISEYQSLSQAQKQQQKIIDEKQEQILGFEQMTYLKKHKQNLQNIISEDELNQINNQNWDAVDSMKQQERNNYVNLIQNTLPSNFIEKLKKKVKITQNQTINKSHKLSQMIPEINKLSLNQNKTNIKQQKDLLKQGNQVQQHDQNQNHKTTMDQIHLNVKTTKLSYLPQNVFMTYSEDQKNALVNRQKIYEMLTSQNNQSQIIGSQLALTWIKNIFPTQNTVFFVDQIPFHNRIMIVELYQFLAVIQSNLKKTKFYSCYIQLLVKAVQILTLMYKSLSGIQLSQQCKFIESEFEKSQKSLKQFINSKTNKNPQIPEQNHQKEQKQMIYESLGIMLQSLKIEKISREQKLKCSSQIIQIQEKFQNIKSQNKINDLIEAILIEQTLKRQEFTLYEINPIINVILQTINDYWNCKVKKNFQNLVQVINEIKQFYIVIYKLICKFNKKKRSFPFYKLLVEHIYTGLLEVIQQEYLKKAISELFSKKINDKLNGEKNIYLTQLKTSIAFKILFIYRQLSCKNQKLALFLQGSRDSWTLSQDQAYMIVYINFSHYLNAQDIRNQETQMIEKMLFWLKNQVQNPTTQLSNFSDLEETLISLLGLFLSNQQQVYSLIDQNVLNDVFEVTIRKYETQILKDYGKNVENILTEVQIKQMIRNYNYNSFGNDIFTKVILWAAVSFNAQVQMLIGQEVMMRYPMLFYYACEPTYIEKLGLQTNKNQQNCPLLGNIQKYLKLKEKSSQQYYTYRSNQQTKANILKLLFMNLDFSKNKNIDNKSLQKILGSQSLEQTKGFNLNKNMLNEENYFYRYLIQPFMKNGQYKELF